ncbi:MAG: hypothetical protein LQ342_002586 [Letrouitia transgressa]|nr:MAG: hypothetical protein LQ342_002586 [Letrouitia transgressa]
MSMITASTWVPRGAAAIFPTKYEIDEDEITRISELAKLQLEDAREGLKAAKNGESDAMEVEDSSPEKVNPVNLSRSKGEIDDDLKEYDLDHYDSDPVDENGDPLAMFGNTSSLAYHKSNADDPYITLKDGDDEDEKEELQVLATDNMIVAAKVEDEVAHLEIYVYEDEADNLYVHHDVMLPAIPLCVEWLDVPVGKSSDNLDPKGNYVAVGTFDPDIEIWDLDTVDSLYPNAILGQSGQAGQSQNSHEKKKKRKKSRKANDSYHVDAILSLATNKQHRNLLASTSADSTVKLWELTTEECAQSYSYHTDKVCSSAWNAHETTVLLTGSYDRTVVAADMRAPNTKVPKWQVESDVEAVLWNPHDVNYFFITSESGLVYYHDLRMAPPTPEASRAIWKLQAHDDAVSSFDVNTVIPGFLVTGSNDKEVKLWNVQATGPSMVVSRNIGVGKVFTTKFAPDPEVAFRLAVGGSKGALQIWDTSTNAAIRAAFSSRVAPVQGDLEERLIGLDDDSSDSHEEIKPSEENEEHEGGWESMNDD